MNPNRHFFIIGAQRSGTTYLYQILDQHPEIQMAKPVRPEPKYFLAFDALRNGYDEYFSKYFIEDPDVRWYGEKSTTYYESADAAKRIHAFFDAPKIVIILRNPVQRAISNYLFSKHHGIETRSLEECFIEQKPIILENPERFSTDPLDYLGRSEYLKHIQKYADLFPSNDMKILIFEDFVGNKSAIYDLYTWFTVNPEFTPSLSEEKINASTVSYPEVSNEVYEALYEKFEVHNKELQEFLGKDLSKWNWNDKI